MSRLTQLRRVKWLLCSLPVCVFGFLPSVEDASPATPPQSKGAAAAQAKLDPNSAKACSACHKAIYEEWKAPGQMHADAWTDKLYQAKLQKKRRKSSCTACHIPDRVLARLSKGKYRRPKTRKDKATFHEGVTCVSCHENGGAIHGPYGAKTDAHKSVKHAAFGKESSKMCNACHSTKIDVVLPVGKDFDKAGLAAKGKSCIGCHMPEVERHCANDKAGKPVGQKRKGRKHKILGANDKAFVAKAFQVKAMAGGGKVTVEVENMAGHRVPGLKTREFRFVAKQLDKNGKVLATNNHSVPGENALMVAEKRKFEAAQAAGAVTVEVTIEHYFLTKKVADIAKTKHKL